MQKVSYMQTAGTEYFINEDHFRENQCPSCNDDQGHKKIKDSDIADLLERVELPFAIDRVRSFFAPEDPEKIIAALGQEFLVHTLQPDFVIFTVTGREIADEDEKVIDR